MEIKFFFSVKAFKFCKCHENEAKYDRCNFKRGLTVTFEDRSP